MSTRIPTDVGKGDIGYKSHDLLVSYEEAKKLPTFMQRNMEYAQTLPGFKFLKGMKPEQAAEAYIEQEKSNLIELWRASKNHRRSNAGFSVFSHARVRPLTYRDPVRFETIPSRSIQHACRKMAAQRR